MNCQSMTSAEFAAYRGVNTWQVGAWRRRGKLLVAPDGSIDVAASDAMLAEAGYGDPPDPRSDPTQTDQTDQPEDVDVDSLSDHASRSEAERVKAIWTARKARTQVLQSLGELVPAAEMRRQAFGVARITRDRLLALPARVVDRALACDDRRALVDLLEDEIRMALEELVQATERIARGEISPAVVDEPEPEPEPERRPKKKPKKKPKK